MRVIILAMEVSELGEFGLIDLLAGMVRESREGHPADWKGLLLGIGDDAAAWQSGTGVELATADSFIQDVHFQAGMFPWEEVGWKALAINLSDIAAMGGVPRYALVSLALPETTAVEDITAVYRGMIAQAEENGVIICGGNVSRASQIVIDITVLGCAHGGEGHILTRSAARAGDLVAVTGYLGAASAGLAVLNGEIRVKPDTASTLKEAFFHPVPRIAEGKLMLEQGIRAAIDVSDGLCSDLGHICLASGLGAHIRVDNIPVHPVVRANFPEGAAEMALAGGEDYELLFTGRIEEINRVRLGTRCPVTVIGEMTDERKGEVVLVDSSGYPFEPLRKGWQHFGITSA
ncbi:MAG: thiamine-phosphate kinase [Dehalococcoidales bacterium]